MRRFLCLVFVSSLFTAFLTPEATASTLRASRLQSPAPAPVPGMFVDLFDDGVVGPEYSPIGGASLVESGGQLHVLQSAPGDGVLVTFPSSVGGAQLFAFCIRWGLDLALQLGQPGDQIVFSAWEQPGALMTALRAGDPRATAQGTEQVRWEIDKVDDTTYDYRIYKNGRLVRRGRATIPEDASGFRIDKVPGTNKVIGEVLFPGRWEKLWEKDPPDIPYESFSLTSNMDGFALNEVMAGLHTDDPGTEGAIGDLSLVPFADGGMTFTPLGGDLYDVEITLEDLATFASSGETTIPLELQIGGGETARSFALEVKCRGTGTGTCSGQSSCSTKTCPDREYDIGDGNGFQTYTGTCKKATIGLPLCSCSYKLKRTLNAVEIFPGETVTAVVDPGNVVPEFLEADNSVSATPSLEAASAVRSLSCALDADGFISLQTSLQVTTGFADLTLSDPAGIQMLLAGPSGIASRALPVQSFGIDGRSLHLGFAADASDGLTECPTELVVLGATTPPIRYWSTVSSAAVASDADIAGIVQSLLAQLDGLPPDDPELGTPVLVPNGLTGQLIALGDLAVPELIQTLSTGTILQKAYSAYVLGQIGNTTAIVPLTDLQGQIWAQSVREELDYTTLSEIVEALEALQGDGEAPAGNGGDPGGTTTEGEGTPTEEEEEEKKRCCVESVDAVTDGPLQGGKKAGDYYPENANADGTSKGTRWPGDGSQAGDFNIQGPGGFPKRTGAVVQIVATLDGDRSCCTISQHYVIEQSTYDQDTNPVGADVDDLTQSGRDVQNAPFRQTIGANQDSFLDYPSRQYDAPPGRVNYTRKQRFTSCYHSYPDSDPPCEWEKCCVTWVLDQTAAAGGAQTTVTKVGSDCDTGG